MKVAIVILNWNGKALLEQFLPSVIQHSSSVKSSVYVADNASTDPSVSFIKEAFPTVKLIENADNYGFAKGYNEALKHVDEDIYVLLNSDVEVTENWLDSIVTEFENNANTAVIQPKIRDFKRKTHFEYAGAAGGFIDQFGYPYCKGRIFNTVEEDNGQYNDKSPIFWASGACFAVRKSIFDQLSGFDERYFAHQEEIDLSWRIQNLGYDIMYIPNSLVYHVGGATLKKSNPKKTFLNFRNSLFTLTKNLPKSQLFYVLFTRLVLDGVAAIQFLFQLKPKHVFAIVKAHFSFYRHLNYYLKQRGNQVKKSKYCTTKSIVYQYFIKGKRKYGDLKNS